MARIGKKNKFSLKRIIIAVLAMGIAFVGCYGGVRILESRLFPGQAEQDRNNDNTITYKDVEYRLRTGVESVLVIGVDDFEMEDYESNRNSAQADFLMLVVIDRADKSYTALHINRDTMTSIPILALNGRRAGRTVAQVALAHTYGTGMEDSCENTVETVSDLLYGVEIDHYVAMSMDAVAKLNDWVGGVTVKIEDDFSNVDPELRMGEEITLKGDQALTFVRARGSMLDSSNLNRMERQRAYINAWLDAAQPYLKDEDAVTDIELEISDSLVSDFTITGIQDFTERLSKYEFAGIRTVEGDARKGKVYIEFYPDDSDVRTTVLDLFYEPVEDDI